MALRAPDSSTTSAQASGDGLQVLSTLMTWKGEQRRFQRGNSPKFTPSQTLKRKEEIDGSAQEQLKRTESPDIPTATTNHPHTGWGEAGCDRHATYRN